MMGRMQLKAKKCLVAEEKGDFRALSPLILVQSKVFKVMLLLRYSHTYLKVHAYKS
jgi:hypothetical protein